MQSKDHFESFRVLLRLFGSFRVLSGPFGSFQILSVSFGSFRALSCPFEFFRIISGPFGSFRILSDPFGSFRVLDEIFLTSGRLPLICRVQNPDIPRAGRVGMHGGVAGQSRAVLFANRTVRLGNNPSSHSPKASKKRRLNVSPEAQNKRNT